MIDRTSESFLYKIFPIHKHEMAKFFRYAGMMFLILFNYTIMRDIKDALVNTAPNSGAGAMPFLKVFVVLPTAFLFVFLYSKVVDVFNKYNAFFFFIIFFIVFYMIFGFFLYPNHTYIQPDPEYIASLQEGIKGSWLKMFHWPLAIYGNWTAGLFYTFSEIWGNVMLSLLFWWYVNNNTSLTESKRFYPIMAILAQFALIFSGEYLQQIGRTFSGAENKVALLQNIVITIIISCVILAIVYFFSLKNDAKKEIDILKVKEIVKSKKKSSILDGIKYLYKSEYLGLIALIVISYGMIFSLVEVPWKAFLRQQYPTEAEYAGFMGMYSQTVGVITIFFMLIGSRLLRSFSWRFCALLTPIIMGATAAIFFTIANFRESPIVASMIIGSSMLFFIVIVGAIQNVLTKSCKYALFDPTKEMTYIPLSDDMKAKGKAAVDVVGARFGKAGGSLIQVALLSIFITEIDIIPYNTMIFVVIILLWLFSIKKVSRVFSKYLHAEHADKPIT